MKKEKLLMLLVLLFAAGSSFAVTVITNQAELQAIPINATGHYVLGNDIVLTGTFTSIMEFGGTFDGAFHIIDGLSTSNTTYNNPGTRTNGLFGRTMPGSLIQNVGLINVNITADGTPASASPNYIGALVGDSKGAIKKCFLEGGTISLTGAHNGNNGGSLVGLMRDSGSITDCFVLGTSVTIEGIDGIGGFCNSNGMGLIENCYVAGNVDLTPSGSGASGFARDLGGPGIHSCYYNMDLTTFTNIFMDASTGDDGSGMGRTTKEMLTQDNYVDWDFENTWAMIENLKYPVLKEFPYFKFRGLVKVSPLNEASPGDVDLNWENIVLDLDNPGDVYVEVLFGTEPNEANPAYDIAALTLDPVSGLNVTSVTASGLSNGTYYWQVNSYLYGDPEIVEYGTGDPNIVNGPLWTFEVLGDPSPVIESITGDQMTWPGEPVPLVATITNYGESATIIEWVADPADNVTIEDGDTATPTVTITRTPYSEAKIVNAGFEDPVIIDGLSDGTTPTGWTKIGSSGMANPAPGAIIDTASEGEQCLWANAGGAFSIVLSETVQAGATYTLNADIGHGMWSNANSKYLVQLIALDGENELVLAEDDNSIAIAPQAWVTSEVLYTNDPVADANKVDLPLMIKLVNPADGSSDVEFDNVVLTSDTLFPISSGVETVTLTVSVSDGANPIPVKASVEIDVYGDACAMARVGEGKDDLNDLDKDCDIDIEDLALQAATWLNDLTIDTPAASQGTQSNSFNVNFYHYGALPPENYNDVTLEADQSAGFDDWYSTGWINYYVPSFPDGPSEPKTLLSNKGSTATFILNDVRNGSPYLWTESHAMPGNGNTDMMYSRANGTDVEGEENKFDMELNDIPFELYDVIVYLNTRANVGSSTGKIIFNGDERDFTLMQGFDGTFIEIVDGTTPGNYIVYEGLTDPSFTMQVMATGSDELGPGGFQVREYIDPNAPNISTDAHIITWAGESVPLTATVTIPAETTWNTTDLTYSWAVVPDDHTANLDIEILNSDSKTPTVTITHLTPPTEDRVTVNMKFTVSGEGKSTNAYVTIDTYNTVCLASLASNSELGLDLGDINADCNTNLEDFAGMAAAWLVDYSSTEPADQP
ncbi:MAG: hypothetical protein K9M75_12535 [Phycisphaerae bacterium]|nr:hypothetical protein [Phycisphaerae bacterium]